MVRECGRGRDSGIRTGEEVRGNRERGAQRYRNRKDGIKRERGDRQIEKQR